MGAGWEDSTPWTARLSEEANLLEEINIRALLLKTETVRAQHSSTRGGTVIHIPWCAWTAQWLDLKPTEQGGKNVWWWKLHWNPEPSEVMHPGGEPRADTVLSLLTYILSIVLLPTDKIRSHPSSKKCLFAIDGNHYTKPQPNKMQKIKDPRGTVPSDTSTAQFLHPRLRNHCGRGGGKREEQKKQEVFSKVVLSRRLHPRKPINLPAQTWLE